ncbi:adenylyl-sulfate kinase [Photobacterium leiognathi]|uniref:adenylyl-sulfate kinase n=1 Tax=Photobacterium leiognathi TaxID=553611 RepID=UPI0027342D83|nr:shikimate kinase [Photobacterium leiognathi]
MSHRLQLTHAPSVLFLFGLSGAGKSFVGDVIGDHDDWFVYHADDDLTDEMLEVIRANQPFTEEMRDNFFERISKKVNQFRSQYSRVVVTQGAYKKKHRDYLRQTINDIELIYVTATDSLIHQRLEYRINGISNKSAEAIKHIFEVPDSSVKTIFNYEGKTSIIEQLNNFYSEKLIESSETICE